jgi:hypothetical protein
MIQASPVVQNVLVDLDSQHLADKQIVRSQPELLGYAALERDRTFSDEGRLDLRWGASGQLTSRPLVNVPSGYLPTVVDDAYLAGARHIDDELPVFHKQPIGEA